MTKYKREVAMTWITWLSNTGGLMGLCMGMSFVSIAEIIYYCARVRTLLTLQFKHNRSILLAVSGVKA